MGSQPAQLRLQVAPDVHRMAKAVANELANLVSGIEGRAHHLIEAAPTRELLPSAAEALLVSVGRLRTLHAKLTAFGRSRAVAPGTTDLGALIETLGDDLQQLQLGLELNWEPPADLPPIDAGPDAVRDTMLFVCSALLRAERGATRLSFVAERSFSRARPTIKIELTLEWITGPGHAPGEPETDPVFTLDLEAANGIVAANGGELTLSHLPGQSISAVVRLPIAVPEDPTAATATAAAEAMATPEPAGDADADASSAAHRYGGALVLESDPSLRAVLARELKASGRAVFACADGASALSFLEATPDRFELLIVDDLGQLDEPAPLGRAIRRLAPRLKICLLTPSAVADDGRWPGMHRLQKPFGVHELRRKLASILAAG